MFRQRKWNERLSLIVLTQHDLCLNAVASILAQPLNSLLLQNLAAMKIVGTQENTNRIKSNSLYNHPSGLPENDNKKEISLTNVPQLLAKLRASRRGGINARFSYITYPLNMGRSVSGRAKQPNGVDI